MILDDDGNEVYSAALRIAPGAAREFSFDIECRAGYAVSAVPVAGVAIRARAAPGDAFQNIGAGSPLALSAFAGQTKQIFFQISADAGAVVRDDIAQIIVAPVA